MCIVLAFTSNAWRSILHLKHCFQQNFIFKNFIFENFIFRKFYQILFDFILFYLHLKYFLFFFFQNLFYNEQCSFSGSGTIPSQSESKIGRVHSPKPACTPRPRAQRLGHAPAAPCRAPAARLPRPAEPCAPARLPPAT